MDTYARKYGRNPLKLNHRSILQCISLTNQATAELVD